MTEKEIHIINQIRIGDRLNARKISQPDDICYQVELIGRIPDQSLLVSLPELDGKKLKIPRDEILELRTLIVGEVIAFQSRVTHLASKPFQLLYLDMPTGIITGNHRKWPRIPVMEYVNIETHIQSTHFRKGRIANISLSGARVDASEKLGSPGDRIKIQAQLSDGHNIEKTIDADAFIRQTGIGQKKLHQKNRPWVTHGVEFDLLNMSEEDKLLLQAYVYKQAKISQLSH